MVEILREKEKGLELIVDFTPEEKSRIDGRYSFYVRKGRNVVASYTLISVREGLAEKGSLTARGNSIERTIYADFLMYKLENLFRKIGIKRFKTKTNLRFAKFLKKRGWDFREHKGQYIVDSSIPENKITLLEKQIKARQKRAQKKPLKKTRRK
jgi:hypothetical protein